MNMIMNKKDPNKLSPERKRIAANSLVAKKNKQLTDPIVDLNILAVEILDKLSLGHYTKWIKTFNNTLDILSDNFDNISNIESLMVIIKNNIIKRHDDLNQVNVVNWSCVIFNEISTYFLNNVSNLPNFRINLYKFGFILLNKISRNLYIKFCNIYLENDPIGIDQLSMDVYNITKSMYIRKIYSIIDDYDIKNIIFTFVVRHYLCIEDLDIISQNEYFNWISDTFKFDDNQSYDSLLSSDSLFNSASSASTDSIDISASSASSSSSAGSASSASSASSDSSECLIKKFVVSEKDGKRTFRIRKHKTRKRKREDNNNFKCKLCDHTPYSGASGLWYHMKHEHGEEPSKRKKK
jgi:hypothetical protein